MRAARVHHVSVGSNDPGRARTFYDAVMPAVGLQPMSASDASLDYGDGSLLFSVQTPVDGEPATVGNGSHIAFAATDRAAVRQFHGAALAHGGTDAGEPGLRRHYDEGYYAAFVRDPDGHKLEAVTHAPD